MFYNLKSFTEMKHIIYFLLLLLSFQKTNALHNSKTIKLANFNTENLINEFQKPNVLYYVKAKSGLNYRATPKGTLIGKFPFLKALTIVEYTGITEEIRDENKQLKGEWVGVQNGTKIVYVFNAFLSTSKRVLEFTKEVLEQPNNDWSLVDIAIFNLENFRGHKDANGFINLSEIQKISEHPDSIVVSKNYLGDQKEEEVSHFKLEPLYRKRFLANTKLSEESKVFIYNYKLDSLLIFKIKDLNVVAKLSPYENSENLNQYHYMYGLEINKEHLANWGVYYFSSFVHVGEKNPFSTGKMSPMLWTKIEISEFPLDLKNGLKNKKDIQSLAVFKTEINGFEYSYTSNGQLVVVDTKLNKIVYITHFYQGESASLAPISIAGNKNEYGIEQWVGPMFKNYPTAIFGFQYFSFGCPSIKLIDNRNSFVGIMCDNRH